jgi:hypothetical protein
MRRRKATNCWTRAPSDSQQQTSPKDACAI